eukprot:jgi/Mesen1/6247/ME000323S05379
MGRARKERGVQESWLYASAREPDKTWKAYIPELDRWIRLPRLPTSISSLRNYRTAVAGGKLRWEPGPPLGCARATFACGVIDDCIYVAGGWGGVWGRELEAAEVLDSERKHWKAFPGLPSLSGRCNGMVQAGRLHAFPVSLPFSGVGDHFRPANVYNPHTREWSLCSFKSIVAYVTDRSALYAYCLSSGIPSFMPDVNDLEVPPLPRDRLYGHGTSCFRGSIALVGGACIERVANVRFLNTAYVWDRAQKEWSEIANMGDSMGSTAGVAELAL